MDLAKWNLSAVVPRILCTGIVFTLCVSSGAGQTCQSPTPQVHGAIFNAISKHDLPSLKDAFFGGHASANDDAENTSGDCSYAFWAFRERDWNAIQFLFQQGYDPTIRFKWSYTTPELEYSQIDGFTSASPADVEPTITFFGQLLDQATALHGTTDALFDITSLNRQIVEADPSDILPPDPLLVTTGFPSTVRNVYLTTCGSTSLGEDYRKLLQTYFIHTNFSHFPLDADVLKEFSAHNQQCSDLLTWVMQQRLNGYWGGNCITPAEITLQIEIDGSNTAKIGEYVQSTWTTPNQWTTTSQEFDLYND